MSNEWQVVVKIENNKCPYQRWGGRERRVCVHPSKTQLVGCKLINCPIASKEETQDENY